MAIKKNTKLYGESYKITWTSDAGGDATESLEKTLDGRKIKNVKTVPGAGVSAYSVTLIDEDGYDWFNGEGATRSTTAAEVLFNYTDFRLPEQDLTLTVSGAGDTKTGTVYIEVE
jgi:hypothetical protein